MSTKVKPMQSPYICDTKLLPRIKKYLDNKRPSDPVDVDGIVNHLQRTYPDFARKKRGAFRTSVSKLYDTLIKEYESPDEQDSLDELVSKRIDSEKGVDAAVDSDASFSSEADYVEYQNANVVNSLVTDLYTRGIPAASTPLGKSSTGHNPPSERRSTGFLRTQSEPVFNKNLQLDDIGYIDRGLGTSSVQETTKKVGQFSLPPSPVTSFNNAPSSSAAEISASVKRPSQSAKQTAAKHMKIDSPVVILIDDDSHQQTSTLSTTKTEGRTSSTKDNHTANSVTRKKPSLNRDLKNPASNKKPTAEATMSSVKFSQIGGNDKTIMDLQKLLIHMKYPEIYKKIGISPPRGFLLHGPPGCGKTLFAHAIAGELELPFFKVAATELVSGVSGESEERVRELFIKAAQGAPSVLFIDEVDAITPKRETASKDMERRIVSQLLTCLDDLSAKDDVQVLVIGATSRPDALDPALRRAGRFDREISMGIPDELSRTQILEVLCRDLHLKDDVLLPVIARATPGFVGADLMALTREAAMMAVNRILEALPINCLSKALPCPLDAGLHSAGCDAPGPIQSPSQASEEMLVISVSSEKQVQGGSSLVEQAVVDVVAPPVLVGLASHASQSGALQGGSTLLPPTVLGSDNNACEVILSYDCAKENIQTIAPTEQHPSPVTLPLNISNSKVSSRHATSAETSNQLDMSWWKSLPSLPQDKLLSLCIEMDDFHKAMKLVQPSAKREGFATVPDVTWDDIGALKSVREELQMAILAPVKYPEQFRSLGLMSPAGVLLAGPPGCGKTLLAKAVANESGINFISVKGPELLNMYVGESERAVRQVFQRARNSAPCVVFFDELDALCPRRSVNGAENGSSSRIVNQLLTEMDGLEERKQVFVMGATNRPDIIDPAVLRPGRLDKTLYVGLPTVEDRCDILRTITRGGTKPRIDGVDLQQLAALPQCEGYSGADLTALVREASMAAMKEYIQAGDLHSNDIVVTRKHFYVALTKVKPSISEQDRKHYERMVNRS